MPHVCIGFEFGPGAAGREALDVPRGPAASHRQTGDPYRVSPRIGVGVDGKHVTLTRGACYA